MSDFKEKWETEPDNDIDGPTADVVVKDFVDDGTKNVLDMTVRELLEAAKTTASAIGNMMHVEEPITMYCTTIYPANKPFDAED